MTCPFVRAVVAGDLARARELSFADGGPCEEAVFEQLVEWALIPAGLDRVGVWGVSTGPGYRMRALTIATRCAEALPGLIDRA